VSRARATRARFSRRTSKRRNLLQMRVLPSVGPAVGPRPLRCGRGVLASAVRDPGSRLRGARSPGDRSAARRRARPRGGSTGRSWGPRGACTPRSRAPRCRDRRRAAAGGAARCARSARDSTRAVPSPEHAAEAVHGRERHERRGVRIARLHVGRRSALHALEHDRAPLGAAGGGVDGDLAAERDPDDADPAGADLGALTQVRERGVGVLLEARGEARRAAVAVAVTV
jgi:hypothetical protein